MPPFSSQPCGTPTLLYPGRPLLGCLCAHRSCSFPALQPVLSITGPHDLWSCTLYPQSRTDAPKGRLHINHQDSRCDPAAGNGQSLADTSSMMTCHSSAVSASASTRMLRCEGNSLCGRHLGLPGAAADPRPDQD